MVIHMININSTEIEKEVTILKQLIEDYEKNYIMLFKELSDTSFYWTEDGNAKAFFNELKFEKEQQKNHYKTLYNTYKIYEYISEKYKTIGRKIYVDLAERDNILAKYNNCINKTTELIVLYEHLDTSFCAPERPLIINQIKRLNNLRTTYKASKEKVKDTLDRIAEIEREIQNRIASYEIDKINYFDANQFLKEE